MATTLVHEPPIAPAPTADGLRLVAARANLLPDEIVSARQLEVVRKQVVVGLALVVALLIAWFGFSWWQTSLAHGDLDDAQHRTAALLEQQREFAPLVAAQSDAAAIRTQLQKLMAADVPWKTVIENVRGHTPAGVQLASVAANLTVAGSSSSTGSAPAAMPLSPNGKPQIGQLVIAGRAGSKNAVAAYADSLNELPGLAGALITSVTAQGGSAVTFTMNVGITTDALGGRFAAGAALTGGK